MVTDVELFESTEQTPLDFVCEFVWRASIAKERWIHDNNCSFAFWMQLPA